MKFNKFSKILQVTQIDDLKIAAVVEVLVREEGLVALVGLDASDEPAEVDLDVASSFCSRFFVLLTLLFYFVNFYCEILEIK